MIIIMNTIAGFLFVFARHSWWEWKAYLFKDHMTQATTSDPPAPSRLITNLAAQQLSFSPRQGLAVLRASLELHIGTTTCILRYTRVLNLEHALKH